MISGLSTPSYGEIEMFGYKGKDLQKVDVYKRQVQAYLPYTRTETGYGESRSYNSKKSEDYRRRMYKMCIRDSYSPIRQVVHEWEYWPDAYGAAS